MWVRRSVRTYIVDGMAASEVNIPNTVQGWGAERMKWCSCSLTTAAHCKLYVGGNPRLKVAEKMETNRDDFLLLTKASVRTMGSWDRRHGQYSVSAENQEARWVHQWRVVELQDSLFAQWEEVLVRRHAKISQNRTEQSSVVVFPNSTGEVITKYAFKPERNTIKSP